MSKLQDTLKTMQIPPAAAGAMRLLRMAAGPSDWAARLLAGKQPGTNSSFGSRMMRRFDQIGQAGTWADSFAQRFVPSPLASAESELPLATGLAAQRQESAPTGQRWSQHSAPAVARWADPQSPGPFSGGAGDLLATDLLGAGWNVGSAAAQTTGATGPAELPMQRQARPDTPTSPAATPADSANRPVVQPKRTAIQRQSAPEEMVQPQRSPDRSAPAITPAELPATPSAEPPATLELPVSSVPLQRRAEAESADVAADSAEPTTAEPQGALAAPLQRNSSGEAPSSSSATPDQAPAEAADSLESPEATDDQPAASAADGLAPSSATPDQAPAEAADSLESPEATDDQAPADASDSSDQQESFRPDLTTASARPTSLMRALQPEPLDRMGLAGRLPLESPGQGQIAVPDQPLILAQPVQRKPGEAAIARWVGPQSRFSSNSPDNRGPELLGDRQSASTTPAQGELGTSIARSSEPSAGGPTPPAEPANPGSPIARSSDLSAGEPTPPAEPANPGSPIARSSEPNMSQDNLPPLLARSNDPMPMPQTRDLGAASGLAQQAVNITRLPGQPIAQRSLVAALLQRQSSPGLSSPIPPLTLRTRSGLGNPDTLPIGMLRRASAPANQAATSTALPLAQFAGLAQTDVQRTVGPAVWHQGPAVAPGSVQSPADGPASPLPLAGPNPMQRSVVEASRQNTAQQAPTAQRSAESARSAQHSTAADAQQAQSASAELGAMQRTAADPAQPPVERGSSPAAPAASITPHLTSPPQESGAHPSPMQRAAADSAQPPVEQTSSFSAQITTPNLTSPPQESGAHPSALQRAAADSRAGSFERGLQRAAENTRPETYRPASYSAVVLPFALTGAPLQRMPAVDAGQPGASLPFATGPLGLTLAARLMRMAVPGAQGRQLQRSAQPGSPASLASGTYSPTGGAASQNADTPLGLATHSVAARLMRALAPQATQQPASATSAQRAAADDAPLMRNPDPQLPVLANSSAVNLASAGAQAGASEHSAAQANDQPFALGTEPPFAGIGGLSAQLMMRHADAQSWEDSPELPLAHPFSAEHNEMGEAPAVSTISSAQPTITSLPMLARMPDLAGSAGLEATATDWGALPLARSVFGAQAAYQSEGAARGEQAVYGGASLQRVITPVGQRALELAQRVEARSQPGGAPSIATSASAQSGSMLQSGGAFAQREAQGLGAMPSSLSLAGGAFAQREAQGVSPLPGQPPLSGLDLALQRLPTLPGELEERAGAAINEANIPSSSAIQSQLQPLVQQAISSVSSTMANNVGPAMDLVRPVAPAQPGAASQDPAASQPGNQPGTQAGDAAAQPGAAPGGAQGAGGTTDQQIEQIAQKVYDHLRRRMQIDLERLGRRGR